MKRVVGWAGAAIIAVMVFYHVLSTSSFLLSLLNGRQ